jgi:hypothetical protein
MEVYIFTRAARTAGGRSPCGYFRLPSSYSTRCLVELGWKSHVDTTNCKDCIRGIERERGYHCPRHSAMHAANMRRTRDRHTFSQRKEQLTHPYNAETLHYLTTQAEQYGMQLIGDRFDAEALNLMALWAELVIDTALTYREQGGDLKNVKPYLEELRNLCKALGFPHSKVARRIVRNSVELAQRTDDCEAEEEKEVGDPGLPLFRLWRGLPSVFSPSPYKLKCQQTPTYSVSRIKRNCHHGMLTVVLTLADTLIVFSED